MKKMLGILFLSVGIMSCSQSKLGQDNPGANQNLNRSNCNPHVTGSNSTKEIALAFLRLNECVSTEKEITQWLNDLEK